MIGNPALALCFRVMIIHVVAIKVFELDLEYDMMCHFFKQSLYSHIRKIGRIPYSTKTISTHHLCKNYCFFFCWPVYWSNYPHELR